MRRKHAGRRAQKRLRPLAEARRNSLQLDWTEYRPPSPAFTGLRVFDEYNLAEISRYIDWSPFFEVWELSGKYPEILEDKVIGEAASVLYRDAQAMLQCIVEEKWLTDKGVIGLFLPAG